MSILYHNCFDCGQTVYSSDIDDGRDDVHYAADAQCGCAEERQIEEQQQDDDDD